MRRGIEGSIDLLDRHHGRVFPHQVVLKQGRYSGPVRAVGARVERLHLAEKIHVLPEAPPVAVLLGALEADQLVLAASPNVAWQLVAEQHPLR